MPIKNMGADNMSELVNFAKEELKRLGGENDHMQNLINKDILSIIETFSKQEHSGSSGSYAISILGKLLEFKPITPITGEDDEWSEVFGENNAQQNKRCSSVFRTNFDNETAYDIDARTWSDDGGETWFSGGGNKPKSVAFPYVPPTEPERVILKGDETDAK